MDALPHDFHDWLLSQASALRARDSEGLDWDGLAEEIESMATSERLQMRERLTTLLMHLLKLKFQPDQVWLYNSSRNSIVEARRQIRNISEDSPGVFQGRREQVLARANQDAREDAASEAQLPESTFPDVCPWTFEQIMDKDFFPGATKN